MAEDECKESFIELLKRYKISEIVSVQFFQ
jgi:hypothetical protein